MPASSAAPARTCSRPSKQHRQDSGAASRGRSATAQKTGGRSPGFLRFAPLFAPGTVARGLPLPRFTYHARYLHHPVGDGVLDVPLFAPHPGRPAPRRGGACPSRKNDDPVLLYGIAQIVRKSSADTAGPPGTSAPTTQKRAHSVGAAALGRPQIPHPGTIAPAGEGLASPEKTDDPVLLYGIAEIVRKSFADTAGPPGTSAPTAGTDVSQRLRTCCTTGQRAIRKSPLRKNPGLAPVGDGVLDVPPSLVPHPA